MSASDPERLAARFRRTHRACAATAIGGACWVLWMAVAPLRAEVRPEQPLGELPSGDTAAPHTASYARFAVAADEPRASRIGAQVLAEGGSAADAAAATMLALGVTSPGSSGLGGGGFALYWDAAMRQAHFFDFRERAPRAATPDMFVRAEAAGAEQPSRVGGLASGVPGEAAGIDRLLQRFGRLPRERVIEPAARLAEQGVEISEHVARLSVFAGKALAKDPLGKAQLGKAATTEPIGFRPGERVRNPALAATIRSLKEGGAPAFYQGRIAREIVRANRAQGGILTERDLAEYQVAERVPLERSLLGYRWLTAPPPSAGGYTLLASLSLLARWLPPDGAVPPPIRLHALAEAFKGPFLDRRHYFGDPDRVEVPIARLLDPPRIQRRAWVYHPTLAQLPERYAFPLQAREAAGAVSEGGGTSHLCVVDAEGNVAAVTTTINLPFGARYSAAGMWLNDQMDDFARAVGERNAFGLIGGEPNLPGPGHRPVSTMTPTIVLDGDGPVLCIGGSGGSRIVTAVVQAAYDVLVRRVDPGAAVAAPRVHHQAEPNLVYYEEGLDAAWLGDLRARGHAFEQQRYGANVQLIRITRAPDPRLDAVSDPRKGGAPAGE